MSTELRDLLETRGIIVCCGAGGVGKTTVSAALAVAGARLGRRVLVLTIDPSRRLAQCLGVDRSPPEPVALAPEVISKLGVSAPGSIHAWMLDPARVSDDAVKRLVPDAAAREGLMRNPLYRHATALVAGMQEYTAMEALYGYLGSGRYDLVVLDTPPSRHALDFLEAPERLSGFLDGRVFRLFIPKEGGFLRRAASKGVHGVLQAVFGQEFARELVAFLGAAARLLGNLKGEVASARESLSTSRAAFVVVSSPLRAALDEAKFLAERLRAQGLPFEGFILNRSLAGMDQDAPSGGASAEVQAALRKLAPLIEREKAESIRHRDALTELGGLAGTRGWAVATPPLSGAGDDLGALAELAAPLLGLRAP